MNIHFFHSDPVINANFLDDVRVRKMMIENFQMMASALIRHNSPTEFLPVTKSNQPYRKSHENHPSTLWTGASRSNLLWLCTYTEALYNRYKRASGTAFELVLPNLENIRKGALNVPELGLTPFVNCARASSLRIDYTNEPDVHTAYLKYIQSRWQNDTIRLTWTGQLDIMEVMC